MAYLTGVNPAFNSKATINENVLKDHYYNLVYTPLPTALVLRIYDKMNEDIRSQNHPNLNSGKRGACFIDVCHLFQSFKPTLHVLLLLARLQNFQYAFLFTL